MSEWAGKTLKMHEAIARALADHSVDTIFGLMGDGNMFMCDAFIRDCGGRFVAAANESGAALMALGYSAISGEVGVASVTHGPGLSNTITALVQGVKASTPMLLICGDTPVEARGRLQDITQREFVTVTGAGFEQVRAPRTAMQDLATAMRRAVVERRPIVLNVPVEFDWVEIEYQPVTLHVPESRAIVPESEDLDNAVGIIAAAKRPVIIAGRGAASAEARAAILKLAKRIEAPLATTLKAKDMFRGEDFNLGISGLESTPLAVDVILASDCLIFFGASVNIATTSRGSFLKGKRIIQVNQEPTEIGKTFTPDAGLVGDPARMADLMVHWLDEAEIAPSGEYTQDLQAKIAADKPVLGPDADYGNGTVDCEHAMARLERILPADRVLVSDGGRFMKRVWASISTPGPGSFLPAVDFGSIGLALSHAIGAAVAAKGRPVVVFSGDGGFVNGGLAEFNTAVRAKLDVIVVIGNDSCYCAEYIKFDLKGRDPKVSLFDWPDFAPVAIALGGAGVTVRSDKDWAAVEEAVVNRNGPLLIDVKLDPVRTAAENG